MKILIASLVLSASAIAQSSPSVTLSWTAPTIAGERVTVYRAPSCSGSFYKIAIGVPAAGPYTDALVIAGATYAYQVTGTLPGLESPPSNCVVVTLKTTPVILPPITGLTAVPSP